MSAFEIGGALLVGFGISLFIPRALQRRRVRKQLTAASLAHLRDRGDRWMHRSDQYERLYHEAVRTNAALLEHIGDERQAAASQAVADSPAYYDAVAARMAKTIGYEWFDLSEEQS